MLEAQMARATKSPLKIHFYGDVLNICLTSFSVRELVPLRGHLASLRKLWTAFSLIDVDISNEHGFMPIPLPYPQLFQYEQDGDWEMHRGILGMAQTLTAAHVVITNDDSESSSVLGDPVDLLHLRRLYVSNTAVLEYIRTPLLEEIGFQLEKQDEPHDVLRCLEPCLLGTSQSLRRLCIKGIPNPHIIEAILAKYPCITELAIVTDGSWTSRAASTTLISHLTIPNPTGNAVISP
ncbi:hypothetical protein C8R43DRAFT_1195532 [Mycena crocata]|nr:hypothetical protein C8R43DRAFT_1195532 [Mycena crocata]